MALDLYKKRELVFLLLFSSDLGNNGVSGDLIDLVKNECKVSRRHVLEARTRAEAIVNARQQCDALIANVCKDYTIGRIQSVERNVLRLAIFELVLERKVPPKVVFSEAKRLTTKFSTNEAALFVHALLAAISHAAGLVVEEGTNVQEAYDAMKRAEATEASVGESIDHPEAPR